MCSPLSQNQNILISCGGKWVGLVAQLKIAVQQSSVLKNTKIIVGDIDKFAPAAHFADRWVETPKITSPAYCDALLEICRKHDIGLIIPLIDLDVNLLSSHAEKFINQGISILCPTEDITELCFDKSSFQQFCDNHSIMTPRRFSSSSDVSANDFPLFAKPYKGYGSQNLQRFDSLTELSAATEIFETHIIQEFISAEELSVDAFINSTGQCICRVPRVREQIIGGEVYKSKTVEVNKAVELADKMISALSKKGFEGPLNIQVFNGSQPSVIEVNPRLGSGNILTNVAVKGNLYQAILTEAAGSVAKGNPNDYLRNVQLRRYHGDIFFSPNDVIATFPKAL
jgi:carbamoyl-phosphate synthase large subunit